MSSRLIGFDPARMSTLSNRTVSALDQLRSITSRDPAAAPALLRVSNVRFELETLWMPAIARIAGDRSMVGWDGDDPEPPPTPWDNLVSAAGTTSTGTDQPPSENYLDEDHSALVAILAPPVPERTDGSEWGALAPWQQEWLLVNQPDVVMEYMLRHGNVLTEEQLDELEAANGFAEFSQAFLATFGVEVGVRWIAIDLGSNSELRLYYMSDGTVEGVVTEKDSLGLVVDVGEIEIGAGIYVRAGERLVFANEEEAQEAIDTLVAASDVTLAESILFWLSGKSDLQREVEDLWDEHGVEETEEVGGYLSVHGEINGALSLAGDAALEAGVYTTTDADGTVTRQGVRVAAEISGTATEDGTTVTGSASVVVDVHSNVSTGEEFVTITLAAQGGTGVSSSLTNIGGTGINLSSSATQSTVVTTSITLPIDDETAGHAGDIVEGVLSGELPVDAIGAIYDGAEVTIAIDAVSSETVGGGVDAGAAEVESSYTVSQGQNIVTYHKNPNGEMYSQNELDAAIDTAREESGYPVPGQEEAGGGTVSWDDDDEEPWWADTVQEVVAEQN